MFTGAVQGGLRIWTGPSAPDGVVRIHALRHLDDLDLTIVVGIDQEVALRAAHAWAVNARSFAFSVSFSLLVMAWLLVREVRQAQGREERLADNQAVLEAAYVELAGAKATAERKTTYLESTLASISDGVTLVDSNLRLVHWNDRFPAYTGTPREVLRVGASIEEIFRAQALAGEYGQVDVDAEVRLLTDRLRAHTGVAVVERTRPNGRTLELRRAALPDGGIVTLYIDITARKQAEDAHAQARKLAEEAAQQKSRFVAIVSHEIRTPLNAVVNSLALLDQSNLTPSQHLLADTARQAGEALLDLVRDILDLTKAEAGGLTLRPVAFEPRELLAGVGDMFAAQAAVRDVRLVVEVAPEVPRALRADRGRLRQVLMNLVSNAAKFADPGTVTIHAETTIAGAAPSLLISVRDAGPRIPPQEADRLFQPFSRLDNAMLGATGGTGLGLAICDRLTRLMGGQIGLRRSPEGGNEFWFTVPLELAPALPPPSPAEPAGLPPRVRAARVLLVEDLAPNQLIAATILRREGHRVEVASSGAEALALVQARPYDLVLMDLVMPGMGGIEAARRIRALPPPAGAVPIVALTATTSADDRARCLEAGMLDVLGKPVQPADLLATVARAAGVLRPPRPGRAAPAVAPAIAPPAPEQPVLDDARVADLRRGLPIGTLAPLVEECLADMRQRLPILHDALRAGQPRGIDEAAHALAGMAGNFGLAGIEARMRRVMAAVRARDIASAQAAAEGVDAELDRSGAAIRLALREAA
jgi:signal transduction histidine kinase/ActR/RegA family two-component response regulator